MLRQGAAIRQWTAHNDGLRYLARLRRMYQMMAT
jgi:hypothetical protein